MSEAHCYSPPPLIDCLHAANPKVGLIIKQSRIVGLDHSDGAETWSFNGLTSLAYELNRKVLMARSANEWRHLYELRFSEIGRSMVKKQLAI